MKNITLNKASHGKKVCGLKYCHGQKCANRTKNLIEMEKNLSDITNKILSLEREESLKNHEKNKKKHELFQPIADITMEDLKEQMALIKEKDKLPKYSISSLKKNMFYEKTNLEEDISNFNKCNPAQLEKLRLEIRKSPEISEKEAIKKILIKENRDYFSNIYSEQANDSKGLIINLANKYKEVALKLKENESSLSNNIFETGTSKATEPAKRVAENLGELPLDIYYAANAVRHYTEWSSYVQNYKKKILKKN